MTFRKSYAVAAAVLFAVEVLIALYVHDNFVRPYVGDSLVIVLMYLFFRTITPLRVMPTVLLTLLIAVAVEFGQRYNLVGLLGLGHNAVARVVIGTGFDPKDFAAYACGAAFVLLVEAVRRERMV